MGNRKPIITPEEDLVLKYDGREIKFSHIEPKECNLIKVNLELPTDNGHVESEGIWACISDEDKKRYDAEEITSDHQIVVLTRNTSLFGVPWGAYIPVKLNGNMRPSCNLKLFDTKSDILFNQVDTKNER